MLGKFLTLLCLFALTTGLVACECDSRAAQSKSERPAEVRALVVSAIPDQDPEKLQRLYSSLADYLRASLEVDVVYKPVTDYKAAVTAFKVGDLDLVWFGGLTGVQARLQVPEARAIVQRDIDEKFESVFIANTAAKIESLADLKGKTFTFGSESSTSGRLMPQFYLERAGLRLEDFKGKPGFSGAHDKTIELVAAGSFDAGVLSKQVWLQRVAEGKVDASRVAVIWTTPTYRDYHWVLHPGAAKRFGAEFEGRLVTALTGLTASDPKQAEVLNLFGAQKFIPTNSQNYSEIEQVGRKVGLIVSDTVSQR